MILFLTQLDSRSLGLPGQKYSRLGWLIVLDKVEGILKQHWGSRKLERVDWDSQKHAHLLNFEGKQTSSECFSSFPWFLQVLHAGLLFLKPFILFCRPSIC